MINATVSSQQFQTIHSYLETEKIELLITDFNGVLDDYYVQKYHQLEQALGTSHAHHLATLAIFTDTEYIADRTASLEQSVEKFFVDHSMDFTETTRDTLRNTRVSAKITDEAKQFLNNLTTPYVIYTSQNAENMATSLDGFIADVYTRDRTNREKPSVENLQMIMRDYGVSAERICVLGDGLIDDLMPARLLGMKTILISPFAQTLHTIG